MHAFVRPRPGARSARRIMQCLTVFGSVCITPRSWAARLALCFFSVCLFGWRSLLTVTGVCPAVPACSEFGSSDRMCSTLPWGRAGCRTLGHSSLLRQEGWQFPALLTALLGCGLQSLHGEGRVLPVPDLGDGCCCLLESGICLTPRGCPSYAGRSPR